jgi:hypothetical protein
MKMHRLLPVHFFYFKFFMSLLRSSSLITAVAKEYQLLFNKYVPEKF